MTGARAEPTAAPGHAAESFQRWCEAADAIRATTKRLEKGAVLEAYLPTLDDGALAVAARFLSGIPFARHDMRTTQVGGRTVLDALAGAAGVEADALRERVIALGDVGDTAREALAARPPSGTTLAEVAGWFARLASATGTNARRALVREWLASLGASEAQYVVKLLLGSGELRIGLKEAQVEEALARTYGHPLAAVRHANLLRGDVGEVAVLARHDRLGDATLALFHPIGFMLAQPLETAAEIAAALPHPFAVEDKYDGIRAQAHVGLDADGTPRVALYSRTLDEITRGYPEVVAALRAMAADSAFFGPPAARDSTATDVAPSPNDAPPTGSTRAAANPALSAPPAARDRTSADGRPHRSDAEPTGATPAPVAVILDGELLAYDPADPDRALPFLTLQRRLGRRTHDDALLAEVPVGFVAYDAIAWDGALVVNEPWSARRARLERVGWRGPAARLAGHRLATTAEEVDAAFDAARAAGNEGIIAKATDSPYTPGRRGKLWIKLKKALATLDVVVTGAERGHGRRARLLSDYTFAVRAAEDDPTLLNVGKAYHGLTDAEMAALSARLEGLIEERFGRFHRVRPEVVLEVTFDVVQRSARHKAGYALRFPRIVRVRDDKPPAEADTLARVRELAGDGEG